MMAQDRPKLLIVEDDEGLQAQLKWAYEDFDIVPARDRESKGCSGSIPEVKIR